MISVAQGSSMTVISYNVDGAGRHAKLSLTQGVLRAVVAPFGGPSTFEVSTAVGTASVRSGSADWFIDAQAGSAQVGVLAGTVDLTSAARGRSVSIPARWGTRLEAGVTPCCLGCGLRWSSTAHRSHRMICANLPDQSGTAHSPTVSLLGVANQTTAQADRRFGEWSSVSRRSTCHSNCRNGPDRRWSVSAVLALAIGGLTPTAGYAYTAAGDRNFPATLILPQIAPSDAVWVPFSTQPVSRSEIGDTTRKNQFTGNYSKTITERLGIQFQDGYNWFNRLGTSSVTGAQNFDVLLQYETILDPPHEFVLSVQVEQEFGGTGDQSVNADKQSATQPGVTFAKGLGDLPIAELRPLAITGFAGYQVAEGAPPPPKQGAEQRPNIVSAGFSVQYSIPYLVSKVANVDLPSFLRGMTPMIEVMFTAPAGPSYGKGTTLVVAPGVSYSNNRGWEFAIEALIPTTKATGSGVGVIAQLVVQLDYLLPDSVVGRPIFAPR